MSRRLFRLLLPFVLLASSTLGLAAAGGGGGHGSAPLIEFPLEEATYERLEAARAAELGRDLTLFEQLRVRYEADPFNLFASVIFLLAVIHTFFAAKFNKLAHKFEHRHRYTLLDRESGVQGRQPVSFKATMFHFLGEIEAIFGIWLIPLILGMVFWTKHGWGHAQFYVDTRNYTEPIFVVVIMAIAASRPVVKMADTVLRRIASLGKGSPLAWWLSILSIAPLLGSFITEPAAMTIAALLLGQQFYALNPPPVLKYATLGLLFVNVSVGGTLTHFAAPPVLMVATDWHWNMPYMLTHFGWRALLGIMTANLAYFLVFRKHFAALGRSRASGDPEKPSVPSEPRVPVWIILVHLFFLGWTVVTLHHPAFFVGGFLFFIAFTMATEHHQYDIKLKGPVLVGFFLAGLVTHGGLQGWWISPILSSLSEVPLFIGATLLTAVNDNAAITFLASQVPAFSPDIVQGGVTIAKTGELLARAEALEYAVVAGAVTGGGLTVIANAPNPAGRSILGRYFQDGISPLGLLAGAAFPTVVMAIWFMVV